MDVWPHGDCHRLCREAPFRWLEEGHSAALSDWRRVVEHIPEYCSAVIAGLARENAATWSDLADHLDRRTEPALRRSGS